MKIDIKVDEFWVADEDGNEFQAITVQEFEKKKKGERLIPLEEQSYCLLPICSEDDETYLAIENRETVKFTSKHANFTKVVRPKK